MATSVLPVTSGVNVDHRPLLFADIDGTFYHRSESTDLRRRRLAWLGPLARMVFVSSRTVAEVRRFAARHGHRCDFIAENGALAVVTSPVLAGAFAGGDLRAGRAGDYLLSLDHRPSIEVAERAWRALRPFASGGGELQTLLVTGRRGRQASVRLPAAVGARLLDQGALAALRDNGLNAALGGRWFIIWHGHDKGQAVTCYLEAWTRAFGPTPPTGAVGNADNDATLLAATEWRWAIADHRGDYPTSLRSLPGVILLPGQPTAAWHSIHDLLARRAVGAGT